MKFFHITDAPMQIYGLTVKDRSAGHFWKLSEEALEHFPQYAYLGRRTAGGRVRFRTDASEFTVRMTLAETREDINIPLSGSAGADIYTGIGRESEYIGYIAPKEHIAQKVTVEKTFRKADEMEVVTINLPRNDHLLSMEIGVPQEAVVAESPAYTISEPIVFYGSSITEGGCASRVGNAYTSILCRWLDADYLNLGFSGSAKGEPDFAEYIANLRHMSAFVYDYDHNAPSPEHLQATHENFFRIVRERHPELPILILTRPDVDKDPEDSAKRRDIIFQTYRNARAAGDQKVWFIDGGTFFGKEGRAECTVDGTHPNALGFMRMAQTIYPVLKEILSCTLS